MTSSWISRLIALVRAYCAIAKGKPPSHRGSKDKKWLMYTGCQHPLEREDDMWVVSTSYRHLFWSEDEELLAPSAVDARSAGLRCHED